MLIAQKEERVEERLRGEEHVASWRRYISALEEVEVGMGGQELSGARGM